MVALSEVESNGLTTLYGYCRHMRSRQEDQEERAQDDVDSRYGSYPLIKTKITQHQKKFTKQEVAKLAKAYRSGKTVYELADIFDCTRETVSNYLKAEICTTERNCCMYLCSIALTFSTDPQENVVICTIWQRGCPMRTELRPGARAGCPPPRVLPSPDGRSSTPRCRGWRRYRGDPCPASGPRIVRRR